MIPLLWRVFLAFAKVGLFGYGGGPSMVLLVQKEVVDAHHWLTNEEFVDALAIGNALPGPVATKMATYIGYMVAGFPGVLVSLVGIVFPSFVLMLLATVFFAHFHDWHPVQAILKAVRPVVVAMLAMVIYRISPYSITSWDKALIAAASFLALLLLKIHPALIIMGAALLGLAIY